MNFKEKVQSMTGKEIVTAMIDGLKSKWVNIRMSTFGENEEGVCYGCAATNTICQISGVKINAYSISDQERRSIAISDGDNSDDAVRFLDLFESAVDFLRMGAFNWYNSTAKQAGIALLPVPKDPLPELTTSGWERDLIHYENYRDSLK